MIFTSRGPGGVVSPSVPKIFVEFLVGVRTWHGSMGWWRGGDFV
jgi:hypothetical protein